MIKAILPYNNSSHLHHQMIPSLEYVRPLDNMEIAKYCPIRLLAELETATYGPRVTSPTVTSPSRPSTPTNTAGTIQQRAIAGQAPAPLEAVSRPIGNPNPMTGTILAPNCNNQISNVPGV